MPRAESYLVFHMPLAKCGARDYTRRDEAVHNAPERVAATIIRVKKRDAVFHVFRYRVLFVFTQNLSRERVVKDLCFIRFRVVIPSKTAHQCSHVVHFKNTSVYLIPHGAGDYKT